MSKIACQQAKPQWARSSRYTGRHHLGTTGGIISVWPGDIVGIRILRLLARTIRRDLVRPVKQFSVNSAALDQPMKVIAPTTTALLALDVEHVELADQVSENDGSMSSTVHGPARAIVPRTNSPALSSSKD